MKGKCSSCKNTLEYISKHCKCTICENCCKDTEKRDNNSISAIESALKSDHFPFLSKFEYVLSSFSDAELARLNELVEKEIGKRDITPASASSVADVKAVIVRGKRVNAGRIGNGKLERNSSLMANGNGRVKYVIKTGSTSDGRNILVAHKKSKSITHGKHEKQPTSIKKTEKA